MQPAIGRAAFSIIVVSGLAGACGDRFTLSKTELSAFGHEAVSIEDADCALPTESPVVRVAGVDAVLPDPGEDGCKLSFTAQGGPAGRAPVVIGGPDDAKIEVEGLSYRAPPGGDLFTSSWAIGGSLGTGMAAMFLSYDVVIEDASIAFFFRQVGAYCPHPLVRKSGVPKLIGLADIDPQTGALSTDALLTEEVLEHLVYPERTLAHARLNAATVAQNQSVPGMHDVTWPYRPLVYEPGPTFLFERLLRFPNGVPDEPTPIMDTIRDGAPTFVVVSMDMIAYALDAVYVADDRLAADFDRFLGDFASMSSEPVVLSATMPDTASLPSRPFSYAERYENIRVNRLWQEAVARSNAALERPRFFVAAIDDLFYRFLAAEGDLTAGPDSFPLAEHASGWPTIRIEDSEGQAEAIGLGRFHGFFTLDHVHGTPTGHAIIANFMLAALNAAVGPKAAAPKLDQDIGYVDVAAVLTRDPGRPSRLAAEAEQLGIGDLDKFLDPRPPRLTMAERCAIGHGAYVAPSDARCPTRIRITDETGAACSRASLATLPARLTIEVTGADGRPIAGAAVGVAAIPAETKGLMDHVPTPELTDADGKLSVRIEQIEDAQASGALLAVAGTATATCALP